MTHTFSYIHDGATITMTMSLANATPEQELNVLTSLKESETAIAAIPGIVIL